MAFSTSAALLALVALASCRNINVGNKCNSDSDKTSIGRCVRPWLDLWELQRTRESSAAELVFPLVFYRRESVLALCDLYQKSRDDCLSDKVLNTCSGDSMISFVQSHMKYFCGESGSHALNRLECINKAVNSNPACREHIRGIPLPNHQASKCLGMPQFFKCVEPEIDKRCGASGLAVMVQAIDAFGCKFSDPDLEKSGEVQTSFRVPASAPSARPQLRSDVVRTLEQSNSDEGLISVDVASEESSSKAPLETSRGPGLVLMESSAQRATTEEPVEVVTKLRDLKPKGPTTRGPGLIMLPRDGQEHPTSPPPSSSSPSATTSNVEGSGEEDQIVESDSSKLAQQQTDASARVIADGELEGSGEEESGSGEGDVLIEPDRPVGSLDKDVTTTPSPSAAANTLSPASLANSFCDQEKQTAIGNCFLPLSKRWEGINAMHPDLGEVIFPLFNYSTADLLGLCEVLQVTIDDCLSKELLLSCSENDLVTFVNSLLGYACAKDNHAEFFMDYDCMSLVMEQNQNCFAHIPGKYLPGMPKEKKCVGMQAFYDCMEGPIGNKCAREAKQTFLKAVVNFGCDVAADLKQSETKKGDGEILPVVVEERENKVVDAPIALPENATTGAPDSSNATSASDIAATSEEPSEQSTNATVKTSAAETSASPAALPVENNIDEAASSSGVVTLSPECTVVHRARARDCIEPLMTTWTKIRNNKPQLTNITFPLYKYQREELLELCDGYANAFLCAGFDPIQKCLTDEMVRFANDHLGYVCSPQNIVNFMRHYDCIMDLVGRSQQSCVPLIKGKVEVGNDTEKCKGVPDFYKCMKGSIELNCRPTALQEFEGTISQFGCELS